MSNLALTALLFAALAPPPPHPGVTEDQKLSSSHGGYDYAFGSSLSMAGDVNGDGYDDLVTGAPGHYVGTGVAWILLGSASGLEHAAPTQLSASDSNILDAFGGAVAWACDVDGDGYEDLVVGAYLDDDGADDAGSAYVYLGSAAGVDTSTELELVASDATEDSMFGGAVAGAGDVNGDGYDDVLVGAWGTGDAYEVFCDLSHEGGGWTLAAHIDDVNDPYFEAQQTEPWETDSVRNETTFPSWTSDIAVTSKYATWSTLAVTDMYIYYKNDDVYFLCEGLDWVETLEVIFADSSTQGYCSSTCTIYTEDRMPESSITPAGLNCNDPNEGWMSTGSAENARVGALSNPHSCCVYNAFIGAAGDRGFSTSDLEKTWAAYSSGEEEDDNIMVFVR